MEVPLPVLSPDPESIGENGGFPASLRDFVLGIFTEKMVPPGVEPGPDVVYVDIAVALVVDPEKDFGGAGVH